MCARMFENGSFDPSLCPLLRDLDPDEIAARLRDQGSLPCMTANRSTPGRITAGGKCTIAAPGTRAGQA